MLLWRWSDPSVDWERERSKNVMEIWKHSPPSSHHTETPSTHLYQSCWRNIKSFLVHKGCTRGFLHKRKPKTDTEDVNHCVCAFMNELACYNLKCMCAKPMHVLEHVSQAKFSAPHLTRAWTFSVFSLTPTYTFISACLILFHVSCKTLRFCSQPDASFFFLHAERERENRLGPFVPPFNSAGSLG